MKTINLYKFTELSPEARQTAIKWWISHEERYGNPLEGFKEMCEDQASELGFRNCEFRWSLSSSQGDGLSFSGAFDMNRLEDLYKEVLGPGKDRTAGVLADYSMVEIKGNTGRYAFAHKSQVELWIERAIRDIDNICTIADRVEEILQNEYYDLCRELEKLGYGQIDLYFSDENAEYNLIESDYYFTAEGKFYE